MDVWERLADLADAGEVVVDLGSDQVRGGPRCDAMRLLLLRLWRCALTVRAAGPQTSCHNAFGGGYCPVGMNVGQKRAAKRRYVFPFAARRRATYFYFCPGMQVEEMNVMSAGNPDGFKELVQVRVLCVCVRGMYGGCAWGGFAQASLRRQVAAINRLAARGLRFWDYGA